MKTCFLAVLLALASSALAEEAAYVRLIGIARSAVADSGPDAEDGSAPAAKNPTEDLKDAVADVPAPRRASGERAARREDSEGAVAAPASPAPRLWTRLYSTLVPSWSGVPSLKSGYSASASTMTARGRAAASSLVPPPGSEAVKAGERRGLVELTGTPVVNAAGQ